MKFRVKTLSGISLKALLIAGIMLSSCISQKRVRLLEEKTTKEATQQFENPKSTTYRIQIGDHLYIKVYSVDPKTSKFFQTDFPNLMNPTYLYLNSYVVDEFGFISFSFVDKMYVKGLTIVEVKDLVQKTLNEYFKECTVVVKLVNFQIAVLGEVNNPGDFKILRDHINVLQAIGLAGGIKDFGNRKNVKLIRQSQNGSNMYFLDLTDNRILESPYFYLMPNDVLYIGPMGAKSSAYSTFPYQTLFYALSTILLGVNIYLINFYE